MEVRELTESGDGGGYAAALLSETTAMFTINDGQPPYFDFTLSFIATDIPPLGFKTFALDPHVDGPCGGGDTEGHTQHIARGTRAAEDSRAAGATTCRRSDAARAKAIGELQRHPRGLMGEPGEFARVLQEVVEELCADSAGASSSAAGDAPAAAESAPFALENKFLKVMVDPSLGIQSVLDKTTGELFHLNHTLVVYDEQTKPHGYVYFMKFYRYISRESG